MSNLQARAQALSAQVAALGHAPKKKKEKKAYTHSSFAYKALGSRPAPWLPKKVEVKKKEKAVTSPYQYEALRVKDGQTPTKGVDYFTTQEVEQMKQEIFSALSVFQKQPDKDEIIKEVLEMIKDKKLSINDLADAESFVMRTRDGLMTRYKFEELMHGAGTGGGTTGAVIAATNSGNDQDYTLAEAATTTQYFCIINNGSYAADDTAFPFSVSGTTLTFTSPLPSELANTQIYLVCV